MILKGGDGQASTILNIVLIIVVIGILGVYFLRQYRIWDTKKTKGWPLNISPCPDNWEADGNYCKIDDNKNFSHLLTETDLNGCNIKQSEKDKIYYSDFSGMSDIAKCNLAKKCNIAWDGISSKC